MIQDVPDGVINYIGKLQIRVQRLEHELAEARRDPDDLEWLTSPDGPICQHASGMWEWTYSDSYDALNQPGSKTLRGAIRKARGKK